MRKRILIIEDDLAIAELQKDYLEMNGFEAETCSTGDEGLARALTGGWNLVLLDLQLPGVDGFQLCRAIREMHDIPILIVSAKNEEIDKIKGLGYGADDFVSKPFSPSELIARVKAHLARYDRLVGLSKSVDDDIRIRGLVVQPAARRVFANGKETSLTAKEFDLLLFLAQHPNRVFHKDELFERIWGLDSMGDMTTVTVHVRKIREKIEDDPSRPVYIETVWGAGYRMIGS